MKAQQDKTPLVSVVMPAYNAAEYIEQAIRSIQTQTVEDWELLVVDDGSTDGSQEIVERLAGEDQRIQLIINEKNMGAARTRNKGLDLCRGDFIALLDSDDVWYPDKLEKQLALAEQTQGDIIYCSYAIIDQKGAPRCADFIVPTEADLELMLVKSVISCSTALLRRSTLGDNRFPLNFYHEDYAFWLDLLRKGLKAVGTADVLAGYRVGDHSRASNKLACATRRWKIYRKFLNYPFWRSLGYLRRYAFAGIVKYRKKQ